VVKADCLKGGIMKARTWWIIASVALLLIVLLVAAFWGTRVSLVLLSAVGTAVGAAWLGAERPELGEYKVREDAGDLWAEAFPDKLEMVNRFRELIDDAFIIPESALGKVAPNDRIHGLYKLCLFLGADNLECEYLVWGIKDDFGIEVDESLDWMERTFGDLFQHILDKKEDNSKAEQNQQVSRDGKR
jgi:hypothetical protein